MHNSLVYKATLIEHSVIKGHIGQLAERLIADTYFRDTYLGVRNHVPLSNRLASSNLALSTNLRWKTRAHTEGWQAHGVWSHKLTAIGLWDSN